MSAGFEIVREVLSDRECEDLAGQLVAKSRAGARHLLSSPYVAALASNARLHDLAASVLGGHAIPFRATLFNKTADANWAVQWHQDTALPLCERFERTGWGPWSTKEGVHYAHAPTSALERVVALRVHLDDSRASNGPLRVIPGSHLLDVLSDEEVAEHARTSPAVECIVPRGDVLVMRPLIIHSSAKVIEPLPRRVLHIEYADALELEPGIELAIA